MSLTALLNSPIAFALSETELEKFLIRENIVPPAPAIWDKPTIPSNIPGLSLPFISLIRFSSIVLFALIKALNRSIRSAESGFSSVPWGTAPITLSIAFTTACFLSSSSPWILISCNSVRLYWLTTLAKLLFCLRRPCNVCTSRAFTAAVRLFHALVIASFLYTYKYIAVSIIAPIVIFPLFLDIIFFSEESLDFTLLHALEKNPGSFCSCTIAVSFTLLALAA